jgi:glutaredoxin
MITVYGADWCEDTRRSRRHLRRLGALHAYRNVDADPDALGRAKRLNQGRRRTPVIEMAGEVLVEPPNEQLTEALVRHRVLTPEQAYDRLRAQNVGDLERVLRTGCGAAGLLVARTLPPPIRGFVTLLALGEVFSGATGWCPAYALAGVTSLGGPGDHPAEAGRRAWVIPIPEAPAADPDAQAPAGVPV